MTSSNDLNEELIALQKRYVLARAYPGISETSLDLLVSAQTQSDSELSLDSFWEWFALQNRQISFNVEKIPLQEVKGWYFDEQLNWFHDTGKFFSIEGIRVKTNSGLVTEWSQPIIHQPEIGILGILCQKQHGILRFLMQAKVEPGNVNKVQLSPTVQATRSNYTQVHGGKRPHYLDYFLKLRHQRIIVDQFQSEQGARFLKKRNRNMIIEISPDIDVKLREGFCWLTLGQLKQLIKHDNIINMDSRTVLSCTQLHSEQFQRLPFSEIERGNLIDLTEVDRSILRSLTTRTSLFTNEEIISWFTARKTFTEFNVNLCNINELEEWRVGTWEIAHESKRFFKVIGVKASIGNREVSSWCQPLVEQRQIGIIGFISREIDGILHILVQSKLEPGNFDMLEMAPTVQCITGNYRTPDWDIPYLEYFTGQRNVETIYDSIQSEEGGRFFQEQNRNIVVKVGDEFPLNVKPQFIWMTLRQIKEFTKFNNYFNMEARSLLACISVI